ncbi:MAG TPA: hypothetical protein VIX42_08605 [Edaphobacter sp.]
MMPFFADPFAQNPTPTGKFGFGWGFGSYGFDVNENGPTVFGGPIQSPVFLPGTYVMTSGTVDIPFLNGNEIDPKFGDGDVTIPTAGDILTITREGDMSPIPEPSSFYLVSMGLLGIAVLAKRVTSIAKQPFG